MMLMMMLMLKEKKMKEKKKAPKELFHPPFITRWSAYHMESGHFFIDRQWPRRPRPPRRRPRRHRRHVQGHIAARRARAGIGCSRRCRKVRHMSGSGACVCPARTLRCT